MIASEFLIGRTSANLDRTVYVELRCGRCLHYDVIKVHPGMGEKVYICQWCESKGTIAY